MGFGIGTGDLTVGPLTKGLKVIFMQAYQSELEMGIRNRICTVVKSDSDSEDYSWLGAVPQVREFIGERQMKDLANFNYNIKNKEWEVSLGIKRSDLADQKFGMITTRIQELAQQAARHQDQLVLEFIKNATTTQTAPYLCYDGQGFIDNDHPTPTGGSANQDNLRGAALSATSLWANIAAMRNFRDDNNVPLNITPDVLLVEPCLEQTARELVATWSAGSAQMAAIGQLGLDVIVSPYLYTTDTVANGNWWLLCTKRAVRPVIFQERNPIEFVSLTADSETGIMRNEYVFGTYARYNIGAGPWFTIIADIGAG